MESLLSSQAFPLTHWGHFLVFFTLPPAKYPEHLTTNEKRPSTRIRCLTQPTFPGRLGAITTPFKFRVMPFGKQHTGLKSLMFSQGVSCSKPSERVVAKPGNKGTFFSLLIRDKLFSFPTTPSIIHVNMRVPIYLRRLHIYLEISYNVYTSYFLFQVPHS